MRIVIVGAGAVGSYLAERLTSDGQDVVVIEANEHRADELRDLVDCKVISGNGASIGVLEAAGVADADLLIAVTSSDAVNVLASQAAARLGGPRRVARVQDPTLREDLQAHGVDVVIDPVEALARELLLLVRREDVNYTVSRLGCRVRMQCCKDKVAGLRHGESRFNCLQVTHLAQKNNVGVFAEHRSQGPGKRVGIAANLALGNE